MSVADAEGAFYDSLLSGDGSLQDSRFQFFLAGANGAVPVVDPDDLANGSVPVWNSSAGRWEPGSFSGGGGAPPDLTELEEKVDDLETLTATGRLSQAELDADYAAKSIETSVSSLNALTTSGRLSESDLDSRYAGKATEGSLATVGGRVSTLETLTGSGRLSASALSAAFVRFVDQNGDPLPAGSVTTIIVNTVTGDIDDIIFEEA